MECVHNSLHLVSNILVICMNIILNFTKSDF